MNFTESLVEIFTKLRQQHKHQLFTDITAVKIKMFKVLLVFCVFAICYSMVQSATIRKKCGECDRRLCPPKTCPGNCCFLLGSEHLLQSELYLHWENKKSRVSQNPEILYCKINGAERFNDDIMAIFWEHPSSVTRTCGVTDRVGEGGRRDYCVI